MQLVTCMCHINLSENDDIPIINKTGRILFKTQRSFSVPTAKETKSTEETEPKVSLIHNYTESSTSKIYRLHVLKKRILYPITKIF